MWKSLVCVALLFVTDIVVSKPDYLFNQNVNGWLKLHVVPTDWEQAFLNCLYEGADLASPINAQFATALSSIINKSELVSPIFLGVNAGIIDDFISIEGVPVTDFSITWGTNGDGNTTEDCLSLSPDGKTYYFSCKLSLPYICYKKRYNTTILNRCGTFDNDYHYYNATGSCYKYHDHKQTWTVGNKICAAKGGHLVIINDQQEADIVKNIVRAIGADETEENGYVGIGSWINDHTWLLVHGEKIANNINKLFGDIAMNDTVGCAVINWSRGYLNYMFDCDSKLWFICEKDPKSIRFEKVPGEV